MPEEEQQYIEKYCPMCKKERVFVTSVSPIGDLVCTQCRYRESIKFIEMIQGKFGFKIIRTRRKL